MNKIKRILVIISLTFVVLFSSCKPEKKETVTTENYKGLLIVNEGGFMKSNGSISLFKPGTGDYLDAFLNANNRPLGDVVQSMTLINNKYYIVVNNSNKIEVVNQSDFKSVTTIPVNQPRNILMVSGTKAYISQLNSTSFSVLDLNTNTISKTIEINSGSDHMAMSGKTVYVGEAYGSRLYMINAESDKVIDTLTIGSGLSNIVNINSSQIGVFCIGSVDFTSGNIIEKGKIAFIDSDSIKIKNSVDLNTAGFGGTMATYGGNLFYTFGDGSLYAMSSTAIGAPTTPFIAIAGSIYGVSIDPTNSNLYLTDAGNYNSAGKIYVYNSLGVFQKELVGGIVPSKVVFNY